MPVYKDESNNGTWYVKCIYEDYTGTKHQKKKRGFKLQRDAKEWEMNFLLKQAASPSMPFSALAELYLEDKKEHSKQITYETKKNHIEKWILPYFEKKPSVPARQLYTAVYGLAFLLCKDSWKSTQKQA